MAITTEERKFTFTTKIVEEITQKMDDGVVIERYKNPWFQNEVGVRRAGLSFDWASDPQEIVEFQKCMLDIHYFAEKYCKIKRENGTIGPIKLRPYQKDILDLYHKNRFSILCGSRQSGKCYTFNSFIIIDGKNVRIGTIYYDMVKTYRKLTILEKVKIFLYNLIFVLTDSQYHNEKHFVKTKIKS